MSSAVAELDGYLQSMLGLKPPGVSGSKITSITSLCTANIQVSQIAIYGLSDQMLIAFCLSLNPFLSRKSTRISRKHQEHTSWEYSML